MTKVSTFIRTFWKSITSFSYYKEIAMAPMAFSFKYFVGFSFLLGALLTLLVSIVVVPPLTTAANRFEKRVTILYPPDLVITIKNGELTTNASQPLRFPIPFELFTDTPPAISDQKQTYLATIDTDATAENFESYRSFVVATKNQIIVSKSDNDFEVYPLDPKIDTVITKATFTELIAKLVPWIKASPFIFIVVILLLFAILIPLSRLASLVFLTAPLVLIAKLLHLSYGYKKIFQLGLHALTIPTLIQVIMTLFEVRVPFPFFNSLLYIFYALIILASLREKTAIH